MSSTVADLEGAMVVVVVVLQGRRRVGDFIIGDAIKVVVRVLILLPSLATLGEMLSTSITDMGDILSKELSAGAFTSSSSSSWVPEVRPVSPKNKDSSEDETGCGVSSSWSIGSSTRDRTRGDKGLPVSDISTDISISGDLEPSETALWKEDEDAEVDEDGAVVDVDDDDEAVIVVVVGIVIEEEAATVVVVVAAVVIVVAAEVVVVAAEVAVVVVSFVEAVVVVVVAEAVVVVIVSEEAAVVVIVAADATVVVVMAGETVVVVVAEIVAAIVVGMGVIVEVMTCSSFLFFPVVTFSDPLAFSFKALRDFAVHFATIFCRRSYSSLLLEDGVTPLGMRKV